MFAQLFVISLHLFANMKLLRVTFIQMIFALSSNSLCGNRNKNCICLSYQPKLIKKLIFVTLTIWSKTQFFHFEFVLPLLYVASMNFSSVQFSCSTKIFECASQNGWNYKIYYGAIQEMSSLTHSAVLHVLEIITQSVGRGKQNSENCLRAENYISESIETESKYFCTIMIFFTWRSD